MSDEENAKKEIYILYKIFAEYNCDDITSEIIGIYDDVENAEKRLDEIKKETLTNIPIEYYEYANIKLNYHQRIFQLKDYTHNTKTIYEIKMWEI
jgi:hypothetical protein